MADCHHPTALSRMHGFSLLELLIVMVLLIVIAIYGGTVALRNTYNQKRVELTQAAIFSYISTTSRYVSDKGHWPDQDDGNDCAGLPTELVSAGYMKSDSTESPWGTDYSFDCSPIDADEPDKRPILRISVDTQDNGWAHALAHALPLAVVLPDAATGTIVKLPLPRVPFDDSENDPVETHLNFSYVTNDAPWVDKPSCDAPKVPTVHAAFSGMSGDEDFSVIGAAYISVDPDKTTEDQWYLKTQLTTVSGTSMPMDNRTPILVVTQCEPGSDGMVTPNYPGYPDVDYPPVEPDPGGPSDPDPDPDPDPAPDPGTGPDPDPGPTDPKPPKDEQECVIGCAPPGSLDHW